MTAVLDPRSWLAQLAPEVAEKTLGVDSRTIENLENELGLQFPTVYREFLVTMGQDTGGFAAIAPTHTTRLAELLAELPGPDERTARYWRVSIERQLIQPFTVDFYLDLSASDGDDAELVAFSYPPDDPAELGESVGRTFSEQFRHRLFQHFFALHPERVCWLHTHGLTPGQLAPLRQRLLAALEAAGFEPFAPAPGHLTLYRRADDGVSVRHFDDGGLGITVAASTPEQTLLLAEQLRDRMPEQTQMKPPRTA